ncbi:putative F-box protein At3g21120 [Salvia hispanica]|uniref:putative F-box protein At3g21120 n=1 Tax=Salvia hispanica TaxID=49212 RepID=UPI002009D3F7|nr:putative F-box protein At3g21120 [Salvia hispanica]
MDSNLLNHDVVTEILLHCPFTSLLRFRSVCKSWRDHIDSEAFRKSHIQHHADDDNTRLLVQFSFRQDGASEVSMFNEKLHNNFLPASQEILDYHHTTDAVCHDAQVAGPSNGLICAYYRNSDAPVAVCNPSLGLIAILPMPPNPSSKSLEPNHHRALSHGFGIWFDEVAQDYKVVQLLTCHINGLNVMGLHLHASVYSKATNSWRGLTGVIDLGLCQFNPIISRCKNSAFAHWLAIDDEGIELILSFDFRNEGFRVLEIPNLVIWKMYWDRKIFAEGDDSFLVFFSGDGEGRPDWLDIFWLRIEGSMVEWNHMKRVGPFDGLFIAKALCERGCVVLQSRNNGQLLIYNYCDEKYVRCFEMKRDRPEIFEYRGNFVLP